MAKRFFLVLLASTLLLAIFSLLPKPFSKGEVELSQDCGCFPSGFSGEIDYQNKVAYFWGIKMDIPEIALKKESRVVLSLAHEERWIEVDLSEQKLKAWEGNRLFLETPVSTGLPWWPTPTGEFRIWIKLRAAKMEGGTGSYYYYLPNVPYIMYFENEKIPGWRGYGLHGTYWHNDFGNQRSHGCVNLPTEVAKELYYWVGPALTTSNWVARSSGDNPGTKIIIHE